LERYAGGLKTEIQMRVCMLMSFSLFQPYKIRKHINTTARVKAQEHIEGLLKYETTLPAQVFLRIFHATSPVSKYLQTSEIDILSAHRMVVFTEEQLIGTAGDFEKVKAAADTFVQWANRKLQERDEETEPELATTLPPKRT
jgi:hypothetical protein